MENLPLEIQSKILSCVPLEYVDLNCKLVSKTWNALLSHRKPKGGFLFAVQRCGRKPKLRFGDYDEVLSLSSADDSSADEDQDYRWFSRKLTKIKHPISKKEYKNLYHTEVDLIGSCNGLVFLCSLFIGSRFCDVIYSILNPSTGEYFNLPSIDNGKFHHQVVSGFGYDPCNNSYKIVSIQYPIGSNAKENGCVQVYTLGGVGGSDGWRNIGEIDYPLRIEGRLCSQCVLWNGSIHWLDQQGKIVAFDLADEKFRYLPTTNQLVINFNETQIKLLGGYLSIVSMGRRTNIWSFKNKQTWAWSLEYSIPTDPGYGGYEVIDITKNNQVLLWHRTREAGSHTHYPISLCRYEPKTDTLNIVLNWDPLVVTYFQGIPHVNSHVSLKALGVDSLNVPEE